MANPLVAQAHDTDKAFAGTGVAGDIHTFATGLTGDASALTTGVAGVASGLGLLGAAMAPLTALGSAGLGWLIEHVDFLEQALEELTGDPAAIEAQAQTWRNVAKQVRGSAAEYSSTAATLPATWHGEGANSYQGAAGAFDHALQSSADGAEGAASAIETAGVLVGIERGLIRDLISEFVAWLIVEAGIALATSWCSFGASIAVFTGFAVGQGLRLASTIADRLAALSTKLDELSQLVSRMNGSFDQLTGAIRQLGSKVDTASANLASRVDNAGNLSITAQGRVERGINNTPDALRRAADGESKLHEKISSPVGNFTIPGTEQSVRNVLDANMLGGGNYMARYDPDAGWQRPQTFEDHALSTGDYVKVETGLVKDTVKQVGESEEDQASSDTESS